MNMKALLAGAMISAVVCLPAAESHSQVSVARPLNLVSVKRAELLAKVPEGAVLGTPQRGWSVYNVSGIGRLEVVKLPASSVTNEVIGLQGDIVRLVSVIRMSEDGSRVVLYDIFHCSETGEMLPDPSLDRLPAGEKETILAVRQQVLADVGPKALALKRELGIDTDDGLEARLRQAKLIP